MEHTFERKAKKYIRILLFGSSLFPWNQPAIVDSSRKIDATNCPKFSTDDKNKPHFM